MPISIDIDGVIAKLPTISNIFKGKANKHSDIFAKSRLRQYIHMTYVSNMKVSHSSTDALQTLFNNNFRVLLNSARPTYLTEATEKWLERNSVLKFVEHTHLREMSLDIVKSKEYLIEKHKIKVHIDDNPYIVQELVTNLHLNKIYFVTKDKNQVKKFSKHSKVTCVSSLNEATNHLIKESISTKRT